MAGAYLKIVEQPAQKSFRFRYESEGRLSGCILGVNATPEIPSYPKIEIGNYIGDCMIFVSCVTHNDTPYRWVIFESCKKIEFLGLKLRRVSRQSAKMIDFPSIIPLFHFRQHPHKLSSKNQVSDKSGGAYITKRMIQQSAVIEFKDIGIIFIKKADIKASLEIRKKTNIDPTAGKFFFFHKRFRGAAPNQKSFFVEHFVQPLSNWKFQYPPTHFNLFSILLIRGLESYWSKAAVRLELCATVLPSVDSQTIASAV